MGIFDPHKLANKNTHPLPFNTDKGCLPHMHKNTHPTHSFPVLYGA